MYDYDFDFWDKYNKKEDEELNNTSNMKTVIPEELSKDVKPFIDMNKHYICLCYACNLNLRLCGGTKLYIRACNHITCICEYTKENLKIPGYVCNLKYLLITETEEQMSLDLIKDNKKIKTNKFKTTIFNDLVNKYESFHNYYLKIKKIFDINIKYLLVNNFLKNIENEMRKMKSTMYDQYTYYEINNCISEDLLKNVAEAIIECAIKINTIYDSINTSKYVQKSSPDSANFVIKINQMRYICEIYLLN